MAYTDPDELDLLSEPEFEEEPEASLDPESLRRRRHARFLQAQILLAVLPLALIPQFGLIPVGYFFWKVRRRDEFFREFYLWTGGALLYWQLSLISMSYNEVFNLLRGVFNFLLEISIGPLTTMALGLQAVFRVILLFLRYLFI